MVNFIVLIILHLLGDFYLQTAKIAKCKNAKINEDCNQCTKCKEDSKFNSEYIFLHVLLYCIPFLTLFLMTNWIKAIITIILIAVSHAIIDSLSCYVNKRVKQTIVLIADQILHIGVLLLVYRLINFNSIFNEYVIVVKIIFTVLLLMVPCSIFISKLLEDLFYENIYDGIFDVGSIIGILERFLVIIFALFGEFAAIAIIITVKTWARTNDLKEKDFRNKYLLGTLASILLALCCYLLFKFL